MDGYVDPNQLLKACSESEEIADNAYDCDDSDPAINPDAEEVCDEIDNNCDNVVDYDAVDRVAYYRDIDGDGYGIEVDAKVSCEQPEGFASKREIVMMRKKMLMSGASETCDSIDNDCDGTVDVNAVDGADYYADTDGDGFGDPNALENACSQPRGLCHRQHRL